MRDTPVMSGIENYLTDILNLQVPVVMPPNISESEPVMQQVAVYEIDNETKHRLNKELGRIIQKYSNWGPRYSFLYKDKVIEARKKVAESRKKLSELNASLVVSIAKLYRGKGLSLGDLIGEGNVGLMRATEDYNPDYRGEEIEFATYASYWIKQSIRKALYNELRRNINIPYKICSGQGRIDYVTSMLRMDLEKEPSDQQVADKFNEIYYPEGPKSYQINSENIKALKHARTALKSIIVRSEDDEDIGYIESGSKRPYELAEHNEPLEDMLRLVNNGVLDEREKRFIRQRYGLDGQEPRTLKSIGEQENITKERVRQIERDALNKLRKLMITK